MGDVMNGYELLAPFQNKNAGFSRWTYASKKDEIYFIKEFLDPVYPSDNSLSEELRIKRIHDCEEYEIKKRLLCEAINRASDGNLVYIHEFFRCDSHYYITTKRIIGEKIPMEVMSTIPMENRILLCKTIAHSMMKLHQVEIVHADIKENNILLKKTSTGKLVGKIIDFDCSFFENDPPQYEDELGGDQVYLSPEACQFICGDEVKLTCKLDIFSLGLLFHQYLTGKMPGYDSEEYNYAFEAVLDEQSLVISDKLPVELQMMLKGMLECDPDKRLSMEKVYEILERMDFESDDNKVVKENKEEAKKTIKNNGFYIPGDL